jgi:uncharacterized cupredoxin-like copper-binding protein
MTDPHQVKKLPLLVTALVIALVSGCAADGSGHAMMSGGGSGPGIMGGGWGPMTGAAHHGYHWSDLTCSSPPPSTGTVVRVLLGDRHMTHPLGGVAPLGSQMMLRAVPDRVPSGPVTFVAANLGWRTHELVVLPLAAGSMAGQRQVGADGAVDETASLGEASASCAPGEGDGIESGTVGWLTVDLSAGEYELICNLRNHYASGMYQRIVVTDA